MIKFVFSIILFTLNFNDLLRIGVDFYVSTHLQIYEERSSRIVSKGESELVFNEGRVYNIFTLIENEDEKTYETSWSVIVRNMDGTVVFAKSYRKNLGDQKWSWESAIPRIHNEKELYVSVLIKSLVFHVS